MYCVDLGFIRRDQVSPAVQKRKIIRWILLVLITMNLLSSCKSLPEVQHPPEHVPAEGGEYLTASWYGPDFHGRPTASGERFNMHALTCAHKTLKFGTRLRVTNPDNGRSVMVTVNDRGPFVRGRDLDLSHGAAKAIGLIEKGVGQVWVEYLGRDMVYVKSVPTVPPVSSGIFTIQVGSFLEPSNAFRLKQGLEITYREVEVRRAVVRGKLFYRVRVGAFNDYNDAVSLAERLADEGYSVLITAR